MHGVRQTSGIRSVDAQRSDEQQRRRASAAAHGIHLIGRGIHDDFFRDDVPAKRVPLITARGDQTRAWLRGTAATGTHSNRRWCES